MARTDHSFPAGSGSPAAAPAALRGRGAVTNVRHRFQRDDRVQVDDGWSGSGLPADFVESVPDNFSDDAPEIRSDHSPAAGSGSLRGATVIPIVPDTRLEPPAPKTTVTAEEARKMLSRNDSPDIPFDVAVNPYRGCEHGCVYCYARPTHSYLGMSPGLDFETRLVAKANAVEALRAELARPGYKPSPINIGSATDAYQPIERDWRLTRGMLELMLETRHPVTIVTKNALVARDLDLLAALAEQNLVVVYISITTLDAGMARTLEPRAAAPWRRLEAVRSTAESLPFRNPAVGKEITSPFGNRRDPFLGRLALHSGIDFRFSPGERVRPTAPGKVITAGWTGGYGNMVEVDHGNGISTRYGHMSEILVKVGDKVDRDDVIGLAGSTGRSTGTHLHYEVRQDGHAVDPIYFMNAGLKLATYIK